MATLIDLDGRVFNANQSLPSHQVMLDILLREARAQGLVLASEDPDVIGLRLRLEETMRRFRIELADRMPKR